MRILRGTGSRLLPCGCTVGFYETYDSRLVVLVDETSPHCRDDNHRVNAVLDLKLRPEKPTHAA